MNTILRRAICTDCNMAISWRSGIWFSSTDDDEDDGSVQSMSHNGYPCSTWTDDRDPFLRKLEAGVDPDSDF
jgi:hypothetical protein